MMMKIKGLNKKDIEVRDNDNYYEYKDGVLTIPIFEDARYNAREISVDPSEVDGPYGLYGKVTWRANQSEVEDTIFFQEANTQIREDKPAVSNVLKLDLRECYLTDFIRLRKVVDSSFKVDLRKCQVHNLTLEDIMSKNKWYKDREAAIQALPNDVILKKDPANWTSRPLDRDGVYSVVNVFPIEAGKKIGIHLTKNKN